MRIYPRQFNIKSLHKTISELSLNIIDDSLNFNFTDGSRLKLHDNSLTCCEKRYMVTDDNLNDFIGAILLRIEIRDAPDVINEILEVHEVQFLAVTTSKGIFTISNHNEHNGYYGGFSIEAIEG